MNNQGADQKRVEILQRAITRCLKILDRSLQNLDTSPSRYEASKMNTTLRSALKRSNRKVPS